MPTDTDTPAPTETLEPTSSPNPTATTPPTLTPAPTEEIPQIYREWNTYTMLNGTEIIHPANDDWVYDDEEIASVRTGKRFLGGAWLLIDFFDKDIGLDVAPEEYYRDVEKQEQVIKMVATTALASVTFDPEPAYLESLNSKGDQRLVIVRLTNKEASGDTSPIFVTVIPNGDTSIVAFTKVTGDAPLEEGVRILRANAWVIGRGRSLNE